MLTYYSCFLAVKTAPHLGSSPTHSLTDKWLRLGQGRAIGHNSVIFQARTSKFCMEVNLDNTYNILMMLMMIMMIIAVTQPFLKLGPPDLHENRSR